MNSVKRLGRQGVATEIPEDSPPCYDALAELFEHEREAIFTPDLGGRLIYCNPAFCRLTGFKREAVLGTTPPFPWWSPLMTSLPRSVLQCATLKLGERVREAGVVTFPDILHPREGEAFATEVTARRLVSKSGVELGLVFCTVALRPAVAGRGGSEERAERTQRLGLALRRTAPELEEVAELDDTFGAPSDGAAMAQDRRLTPREAEVAQRLLQADRVAAIARDFFISPHTVRNHVKSIYRKLGVRSQLELLQRFKR